tara:strand:+ start:2303 stop:5821 length:3519 start_codon:yes stop_codon:yes gene_type:complete
MSVNIFINTANTANNEKIFTIDTSYIDLSCQETTIYNKIYVSKDISFNNNVYIKDINNLNISGNFDDNINISSLDPSNLFIIDSSNIYTYDNINFNGSISCNNISISNDLVVGKNIHMNNSILTFTDPEYITLIKTLDDFVSGSRFGSSIATNSNGNILIGASSFGSAKGAVYYYNNIDDLINDISTQLLDITVNYSVYGKNVVFGSTNNFIVGAYHHNNLLDAVGAIHYYDNSSNTPTVILNPIQNITGAHFGWDSAFGPNDDFIVGAPGAHNKGAIYYFNDISPVSYREISLNTIPNDSQYGFSVAFKSTGEFIVGAPGNNNGAVYYYDNSNSIPTEITVSNSSHFGYCVHFGSNNSFIVGDPFQNTYTGAIYYYDNSYSVPIRIVPDNFTTNSCFGYYFAIGPNDNFIVGSPGNWTNDYSGKAYFYYNINTKPIEISNNASNFGASIAFITTPTSSNNFIIGASEEPNSSGANFSGAAFYHNNEYNTQNQIIIQNDCSLNFVDISHNCTIRNNMNVYGDTSFNNNVSISNNLNIFENLHANKGTVTGNVDVSNDLTVNQTFTLNDSNIFSIKPPGYSAEIPGTGSSNIYFARQIVHGICGEYVVSAYNSSSNKILYYQNYQKLLDNESISLQGYGYDAITCGYNGEVAIQKSGGGVYYYKNYSDINGGIFTLVSKPAGATGSFGSAIGITINGSLIVGDLYSQLTLPSNTYVSVGSVYCYQNIQSGNTTFTKIDLSDQLAFDEIESNYSYTMFGCHLACGPIGDIAISASTIDYYAWPLDLNYFYYYENVTDLLDNSYTKISFSEVYYSGNFLFEFGPSGQLIVRYLTDLNHNSVDYYGSYLFYFANQQDILDNSYQRLTGIFADNEELAPTSYYYDFNFNLLAFNVNGGLIIGNTATYNLGGLNSIGNIYYYKTTADILNDNYITITNANATRFGISVAFGLNGQIIVGDDWNNNNVGTIYVYSQIDIESSSSNFYIFGNNISLNDISVNSELGAAIYNDCTVDNNVTATGYSSSSDDRLKHNEIFINNGLEVIRQIQPLIYQKTKNLKDQDFSGVLSENYIIETGLIAQDILTINDLSFCVISGNETTPYYLNYNNIFVFNLVALKELYTIYENQINIMNDFSNNLININNEIISLKEENTNLKNENISIKNSLNNLLIQAGLDTII